MTRTTVPFAPAVPPGRQWGIILRRGLLALFLLGLSWPLRNGLDRRWFDLSSRLLRFHGRPQAAVALIGIDEGTERAFPEPMAVWHKHLGVLFEGLALARPQAVGLDLNLPMRSYEGLLPGGDAALLRGLLRLRKVCPVVLGVTVDEGGHARPLYPPFQTVVGSGGTAFVLWERDPDAVVRRFTEHFKGNQEAIPTLSGQMARSLGRSVHDGWLDYLGARPVPYVSFQQVEAWAKAGDGESLRRAFQDKAVLIGSVLPFVDRHLQAVDISGWNDEGHGFEPGVLLHVQALRDHLGRGPLRDVSGWAHFLLALGLVVAGWILARRLRLGGWLLLALLLLALATSLGLQAAGWFLGPAAGVLGLLLGFGTHAGWKACDRLKERQRLQSVFGGYVSPTVLHEILAGRISAGLNGQRARICVLFSDVRGFTTLSEGRDPEAVIALLNRYFDRMTPIIHAHGGAVVSYMGDGIMAHFGHPQILQNPCQAAFDASRAMLEALRGLNEELRGEGFPELRIGIGLHAGEAVVGHLGSKDRHEYTAIGDTVNVASRMEGLTKEAGCPLLVTKAVADALQAGIVLLPLGRKAIKGHSPMEVFGWTKAVS